MSKLLTDDNVLRFAAAAVAVDAVAAGVFPDNFHDRYFNATMPRSNPHTRWIGLALAGFAAHTVAPTLGGNATAKKNALKVFAATSASGAARNVYMIRNNYEKKGTAGPLAAVQAALAGAALYQAFKN